MEWISVKERLPEPYERVLVYQEGGVFGGSEIDITHRWNMEFEHEDMNNRIIWDGQGVANHIHFWMPLPKPPLGPIS